MTGDGAGLDEERREEEEGKRDGRVEVSAGLRAALRAWPSARAFMRAAQRAAASVPELEAEAAGAFRRRGGGGGRSALPDPTASAALFDMGPGARMRARAGERLAEARGVVARAREACALVSDGLGERYGSMLLAVWVEGRSLGASAALAGCGKTTAKRRCDLALDWLDWVVWG